MRLFRQIYALIRNAALLAIVLLPSDVMPGVWVYTDAHGTRHFADQPRHSGYRELVSDRSLEGSGRRSGSARRGRGWDPFIVRAGQRYGLSPALLKAVIHAESGFNERAVSPKGAQGLMQLMPPTAQALGVDDPFNPWQNIDGGTRHLADLVKVHRGDLSLALAAYNAGSNAVRRHRGIPPYRETRRYVRKVLELYRQYHGDFH